MPDLHLSFTVSALLVLLLVLLSVAAAVYFYRTTIPPIPRGKKILLTALRATALSLLLMFLFEPLLRLVSTSTQEPVLAVLVDDSKSMSIEDPTGNRLEQARDVLRGNLVERNAGLRFYTLGTRTKVREAFSPDSLLALQEATDITGALRTVFGEKDRLNIGAVLLISDGSYNLGQNPLYEAEQIGLPVFTVGIGDSTEQKDLVITRLLTNDLVYAETEVPVDVTIKSSGFASETVEVVLADGGRDLARTKINLGPGTREYAVRLSYLPEGEGTKKYSVRVSRLPGELTYANNQRMFLARILKNKIRVVMINGVPSPDVTAIRQTLAEDNNITVRSFTQNTPTTFYEGNLTAAIVDSADCLVLTSFPIAATSQQVLDMVKGVIGKKNTPVLYIGGKQADEAKLQGLSGILPFTSSNPVDVEQMVFAEISYAQRSHPVLSTTTDEGVESWKRLPPIYRTQTTFRAKGEATVLATARISTVVTNDPLILIRNVNRQKSLAVLGYGVWRWRLLAQGSPETERLLAAFLSNSIRWLTTRDDDRPVKVTPLKQTFTQGEPVEFTGQVYDASANPVENADLTVVTEHQGNRYETLLRPIGNGRYEGAFEGLPEGDYTFRASAVREGQPVGDDRGRFSVGELSLEFLDTRMNAQLLRQLAERTGGKFFTPAEIGQLPDALRRTAAFSPREVSQAREFELWNWKYMLALVVLLFAIEWFVRKRSGML